MGCSSEEISEVSDSEIGDYEAKSYSELENGRHPVRNPNGTYRCPFCVRKKKKQAYIRQQILQHPSGIGASNRRAKEKANHRALARYLTTSNQNPEDNQMLPPKLQEEDDQFVWPWKGILRAESGAIRSQSSEDPCSVELHSHTGTAIVDFRGDWSGLKDAMTFEKHFEKRSRGRSDWCDRHGFRREGIHGWIARAEDYNLVGAIGRHLRKKGDLKTIAELSKEGSEKKEKLVAALMNQLEASHTRLQELESRYSECALSLDQMMEQRDKLHRAYNEEMRKIQAFAHDQSRRVLKENEDLRGQLDSKKREVEELIHSLMNTKRCRRSRVSFLGYIWT
ncbi:unnamed protein product [Spirodela intermedia]|uniref:Uncharacterized protein n=1 Tax=Spirodela intermedia TaxID=51605 RepID=A0A7I8JQX9_SPIIN|nr:unnamed protein product [Spirodela intermedia]CAA6671842.1 unnamed protein product [Spirodela intermedia]